MSKAFTVVVMEVESPLPVSIILLRIRSLANFYKYFLYGFAEIGAQSLDGRDLAAMRLRFAELVQREIADLGLRRDFLHRNLTILCLFLFLDKYVEIDSELRGRHW